MRRYPARREPAIPDYVRNPNHAADTDRDDPPVDRTGMPRPHPREKSRIAGTLVGIADLGAVACPQ